MKYGIQYEFNSPDDPPRLLISEDDGDGTCVVDVLEDPTHVDGPDGWSRDYDDWIPGPLATALLAAMNAPGFSTQLTTDHCP